MTEPIEILPLVIADLEAHSAKGKREYGQTLNLSTLTLLEAMRYRYEEILDDAQYTRLVILHLEEDE